MATKTYKVYAGLHEESKEGWIWVSPDAELVSEYVRIRNPQNGKSAVCERRLIDENFLEHYKARDRTLSLPDSGDVIVMNAALRERLGVATQTDVRLGIENATTWWEKYVLVPLHHPHPAIRLGITLGLVSIGLGFLGLLLGIIGLGISVFGRCS